MAKKNKKFMTKRNLLKKLDYLIKDENMATKEYREMYEHFKDTYKINGEEVSFLTMSRDEHKHKLFIEKMKNKIIKTK